MSESEEGRIPNRKQPPIAMCIVPLVFGLIAFNGVAQSPHFQSYRTLDVIRLMTFGASIAVALMLLLQPRR